MQRKAVGFVAFVICILGLGRGLLRSVATKITTRGRNATTTCDHVDRTLISDTECTLREGDVSASIVGCTFGLCGTTNVTSFGHRCDGRGYTTCWRRRRTYVRLQVCTRICQRHGSVRSDLRHRIFRSYDTVVINPCDSVTTSWRCVEDGRSINRSDIVGSHHHRHCGATCVHACHADIHHVLTNEELTGRQSEVLTQRLEEAAYEVEQIRALAQDDLVGLKPVLDVLLEAHVECGLHIDTFLLDDADVFVDHVVRPISNALQTRLVVLPTEVRSTLLVQRSERLICKLEQNL